ncbi:unnamed protein product [Rotaria socialis]|uniref:Uncharacterized protein n=1 Tax=Rotaria socialis TaxID=392032 RepID=A0A821FUN7_9BILA|nr:unnamed protein product [Rotaria socialis]
MATDVLDESRFKNQCTLYDSTRAQITKDSLHKPTTTSTTVLSSSSMSATNHNRRVKYSTQTHSPSSHSLSHSIHNRNSGSTDLFTFIRSFAMKPFKASSMANAVAGGETSNVIGGSNLRSKSSVSLLKYRPLSDVLTDHTSYSQSHHNLRKAEKLDQIWIKNPHLMPVPNQPLTVIFTASNLNYLAFSDSLSHQDHELITLQALICQLDVATESTEVQQNGLNFIYDMRNCSASQFNINLSKKILKLLQGGYPAMLKNIFVISAPKWFRVTFYSADQMRHCLTNQYSYPLDSIPISLGGSYDPMLTGTVRYQMCLSTTSNPQSICYPYYCLNYQPMSIKPTNENLFTQDKSSVSPKTITTPSSSSSSASLLRFVSPKRRHESSSSQSRMRKRESSSSSGNDKRKRSNESLIQEESPPMKSSLLLRKENCTDSSKTNENGFQLYTNQKDKYDSKTINSMIEDDYREINSDIKRTATINLYKTLNETDFLSKPQAEIRKEFRKLPNPPAKDTHAARYEENLDKSRYRDVIPGESTRVKLQEDIDDTSDFINANYVSGYNNEEKAYIFTQGPLQSTVKDFWRMIWQENISIIVMTTNIREAGTMKCYPYWPLRTKQYLNSGPYQILNEKSDSYDSFNITTLLLRKRNHTLMDFIKQEKIIQEKVPSLELTNSKISFELDQIIELPPMNMPTIVTEQESVPDQIGISSDSSLPTVQEIIVSTNETNPETISLMPSTNDEEIDRKVCS